jgi:hypothetical protein
MTIGASVQTTCLRLVGTLPSDILVLIFRVNQLKSEIRLCRFFLFFRTIFLKLQS